MSLTTITLGVAIIALVLTVLMKTATTTVKNIAWSYLQNFCGVWFIFSGAVKAVDPLGTAYKLNDYFAQFETHFALIGGIFKPLAEISLGLSVFMIVLEITLGAMLILGTFPRFTAIVFFLLMLAFTALTGFTYLTGYVPGDATFFEFSKWGNWINSNMKVTDCGCFGDFILLKPFTSFLKDLLFLIPGLMFLFGRSNMHQILNKGIRIALAIATLVISLFYCWSNYSWDIPQADFRPFKEGVNILKTKQAEEKAMIDVEILGYKLTNNTSGKEVELSMSELSKMKNYPKKEWTYEQIKTLPTIKSTKISEFEVEGPTGDNIAEELLSLTGYSFMVVGYKLKYTSKKGILTQIDSIFRMDTIKINEIDTIQKVFDHIQSKEISGIVYTFKPAYQENLKTIKKLGEQVLSENNRIYYLTKYLDSDLLETFKKEIAPVPVYLADDILLKTIIRSNPGVLLLKDGTIIKKWHISKLPTYETIKATYMN